MQVNDLGLRASVCKTDNISYIYGLIPTNKPNCFLILKRLILLLSKTFVILLNVALEKLKFDFIYKSLNSSISNSSSKFFFLNI